MGSWSAQDGQYRMPPADKESPVNVLTWTESSIRLECPACGTHRVLEGSEAHEALRWTDALECLTCGTVTGFPPRRIAEPARPAASSG